MAATILIADDDAVQRRLVENMVQRCGYESAVVDCGDAAVELLTGPDGQNIDWLVLDLVMPGLDGMTPDQLAKVFPDGRTVHQSTSGPMKGYELARADIERRGNGEETAGKPSFLAALFKGKPAANDEDDEGSVPAPVKNGKPVKTTVVAATAPAKPVEKPAERKPAASTLQLASADAKIVPAPKPAAAPQAEKAEPKQQADDAPQTPADIINARGFWDNVPAPQQASPAQLAALAARKFIAAATDPQATASVSENFNKAMLRIGTVAGPEKS